MKLALIIAIAAVMVVPMEFEIDIGSSSLNNEYCTVTYEDGLLTYWDSNSSDGRVRVVFDQPLDSVSLIGDSTYVVETVQKGYSYVAIFESIPVGEYRLDSEPSMIRIDPLDREYVGIWTDY